LDSPRHISSASSALPPHSNHRRFKVAAGIVIGFSNLLVLALGGCSGRSRGAQASTVPNSLPAGVLCGQQDDGFIHIPPRFNDFMPPEIGASYTDPQYGCAVTRLTDAKSQFKLAVHHQYSTISAVNQDDTRVMMITEWGQGTIVDMAGNVVVAPRDFPAINTGNVPWAVQPAGAFYYTSGNALYRGSITGHSVKSAVLHVFAEYPKVTLPDQEDLSEDGDHLWIAGGNQAFLYTISANSIGPRVNIGTKDVDCGWHKIQITPSNKMLITWACNGASTGRGQEIYDTDGTLYWHMFDNSLHSDVGRDLSHNEIAVVGRIPDTYKDACPGGGGADVIRLDPPHSISCLVDLNWAASHISYRDSTQGWVAISLFDQGACPGYSCFPQHLEPDWTSVWRHFYEEVILVKIDGSAIIRLAHHRSRSGEYYWAQSRAAISRDGRYVIFDSNMDENTGLNNYSDVYMIKVR
jgi:hypothetical protein